MPKCLSRRDLKILYHYSNNEREEGQTPTMRGEYTSLSGECTNSRGDCSGLCDNCSGLQGNLDEITPAERKEHPEIEYWIKG